jgi:hypothetical protein
MNIGVFCDTYTPLVSGVITVIRTLKTELEKRGHTVYVFTFVEHTINVKQTISKVLVKLDSHIRSYYKDHIYPKPNYDNCITALEETHVCETGDFL